LFWVENPDEGFRRRDSSPPGRGAVPQPGSADVGRSGDGHGTHPRHHVAPSPRQGGTGRGVPGGHEGPLHGQFRLVSGFGF